MSVTHDDSKYCNDIFDPEILYCITKLTIEPFITCLFDKEKYITGNDYSIVYIESVDDKYLCVAFGEELVISQGDIVKKGNHHLMGTILVVGHKGGTIMLNNPLTNISTMYYAYINSLSDSPSFKKVSLISEKDRQCLENDKIYISNTDSLVYKSQDCIPSIERVPMGSWNPTKEIYPKHILVKRSIKQKLEIKTDSEFMLSSLPSIVDNEIVEVSRPPTPRPISILPVELTHQPDYKDDHIKCCCITYFLIPLYKWFVTKLKKTEPQFNDRTFSDIELP